MERSFTVDGKLAKEIAVDREGQNRIVSTYHYDALGRLSKIQDENEIVLIYYRYRADNRLEAVVSSNDISTCYEYDTDGNISRLLVRSEEETSSIQTWGASIPVRNLKIISLKKRYLKNIPK